MTALRLPAAFAERLTRHGIAMVGAIIVLHAAGCSSGQRTTAPFASPPAIQVTGTLVAVSDHRPVDGGVDLTLETKQGVRVVARVASVFTSQPSQALIALHATVDAARLGDRMRASGTPDESGAVLVESLVLLSP